MGWVLWLILTVLAYASGYALSVVFYREDSVARRLVATLTLGPALILVAIQIASIGRHLATWPLAGVSVLLFGGMCAFALRRVGWSELRSKMGTDLGAPARVLRSAWEEKEVTFLTVPVAFYVFGLACILVWFYRSWMFDPLWYHVTITNYAIQERGLDWIHTHNHYLSGYPRNVELMATWNCIFQMDNRLDDSPQLPFALLGMAATAAWARRLGASRALSASAACIWYALPPVFLLAPSSYVDLATGGMFVAAAYFAFGSGASDRWLSLVAFGLYVGSKFTGVYHFGFFVPILFFKIGQELLTTAPGKRAWTIVDVILSGAAFLATGAHKYIQNFLHEKNPVFPYATKTIFGDFPGPETVAGIYNLHPAPGESIYLFGMKGALRDAVSRWLQPPEEFRYTPEIHDGGYGPTFWWFLFPALVIGLGEALRGKWKTHLPLVFVFLLAVSVPSAYWPRYSIGGPAALAVLLVCFLPEIRPRFVRVGVSLGLVGLSALMVKKGLQGWQEIFPAHFSETVRATPNERASIPLGAHWAYRDGLSREFELREGDVVTYDESASFLANYFTRDYRNRVLFVSSKGDPTAYVARLRAANAVWAGVASGGAAEAALKGIGATYMFGAPGTGTVLYRMPK